MRNLPYGKQTITIEDIDAVKNAMSEELLTTGPTAEKFEFALTEYCGAKYAVAVSSGTAALHLASIALLQKDDKVLTTPNSFIATANSILYVQARPIFVDIEENGNLDLELCEQKIIDDPTIKAIYVVHFSGMPVNQKKLKSLKENYGVLILEDCAHSIGAVFEDFKAGSCTNSDCSIFSFHPVKNMTTGEGGVITTNSKKIYERLVRLRNHGMTRDETLFDNNDMAFSESGSLNPWYYEMVELGYNYRITDIQCALGLTQLDKLDKFIAKRQKIAKRYQKAFTKNVLISPLYEFDKGSSYHLYIIRVDFSQISLNKADFFNKLISNDIGIMVHYIPINKQPYYRSLGYGSESIPVMDRYYEECISIPIFPELKIEDQDYIISTIIDLVNEG
jgi:UDP-4-amino-4,6-dideoxy-N-acetyl-beta-L-altrosamine transaminase